MMRGCFCVSADVCAVAAMLECYKQNAGVSKYHDKYAVHEPTFPV